MISPIAVKIMFIALVELEERVLLGLHSVSSPLMISNLLESCLASCRRPSSKFQANCSTLPKWPRGWGPADPSQDGVVLVEGVGGMVPEAEAPQGQLLLIHLAVIPEDTLPLHLIHLHLLPLQHQCHHLHQPHHHPHHHMTGQDHHHLFLLRLYQLPIQLLQSPQSHHCWLEQVTLTHILLQGMGIQVLIMVLMLVMDRLPPLQPQQATLDPTQVTVRVGILAAAVLPVVVQAAAPAPGGTQAMEMVHKTWLATGLFVFLSQCGFQVVYLDPYFSPDFCCCH